MAEYRLNEQSDKIRVDGHRGTWYVIETEKIDGKDLFLLESEQYGDEAANLIVDERGNLVLDDVYNGFDDYREQVIDELQAPFEQSRSADSPRREDEKPIIPIQEFRESNGRMLAGDEISGYLANPTGREGIFSVSREAIYNAVAEFERNNDIHRVLDENGHYEDKEFLYSGYDEYVALSHAAELGAYRPAFEQAVEAELDRLETVIPNFRRDVNREAMYLSRLAEVYYAKQNGLSEDDISFMVGKGDKDVATMRSTRKELEGGLVDRRTLEALEKQGEYVREYASSYLRSGGSVDFLNTLPEKIDVGTAYYTFSALKDKAITEEQAQAVFHGLAKIHDWNERVNFAETGTYKLSTFDYEHLAEVFTEQAAKGMTAEQITKTVDRFLEAGADYAVIRGLTEERSAYIRVAIESTDDYADTSFHSDLVDVDTRNEDGSFGRTVDYYRIVTLNEDGRVVPLNDVVYDSAEKARAAVTESGNITLISYDTLIDEAGRKLTQRGFEQMAGQNSRGASDKETVLAERIVEFWENYDPAFGYAEGVDGQENKEQWVNTVLEKNYHLDQAIYLDMLETSKDNPQAREEAGAIIGMYAELTGYQPMPNRYYEPELEIDGTADELFIQARNNYVEDPEALHRISEILDQEGKTEEAERVRYMEQREREDREPYSVGQMKLDFMDGLHGGVDDVEISDGLRMTVTYEKRDDTVVISLDRMDSTEEADVRYSGANSIPLSEFKTFTKKDFDSFVGQTLAYNMLEVERVEKEREREIERPFDEKESPRREEAIVPPVEDENLTPKERLQKQLENGVRAVMDSDTFKNWLATQSRIFTRQYSFQNAILVWLQKPDASHTMGYEAWKDFGRNVKQGAQGAKIFVPLMASEKYKGGLFNSIKKDLTEKLANDSGLNQAVSRLGTSKLEFTMNRNGLIGLRVDGREKGVFHSDEEVKRFIDRSVIGKVPFGFTVGTVFDAKDTIIPEHLWVRKGYTKDEVVKGEDGKPIKNRKGEVKIINTPERQARFQPYLDTSITAKDPEKMAVLFATLKAVSERKGVPVIEKAKDEDEVLKGGAKGYFSRAFTAEFPKGFIVVDKNLDPTEKNAVLLHEEGHADLHGNLEALKEKMGEDRIPSAMREIQAEATAYAVAQRFGIETDTSSFSYLAAYTNGFEQQDFQRSLEVIFKEVKELTADIEAELDIRGLDLALEPKEKGVLEVETIKNITAKYVNFATEQDAKVVASMQELPSVMEQAGKNLALLEVVKYQNANLEGRKKDIDGIIAGVEALNKAQSREEQEQHLATLDAAVRRVQGDTMAFDALSERFVELSAKSNGDLQRDFKKSPEKTLAKLQTEHPRLAELSDKQISFIAKSKFIASEYSKLLRSDPKAFVDAVCDRAENAEKVAARNGTFVEVSFCEQWTDKPIFENGTLCHPKIAEQTITASEAVMHAARVMAEKNNGEYVPYAKCDITVFTPDKKGGLVALNTRVDIGDGAQKGLKDHLDAIVGRSKTKREVVNAFEEANGERGAYKAKIHVQDKATDYAEKGKAEREVDSPRREEARADSAAWVASVAEARAEAQQKKGADKGDRQHQHREHEPSKG